MKQSTARHILPIIQHIAEHGPDDIEYLNNRGVWVSGSGCRLGEKPERYRIKPKPVTRPWNKPEDVPGPVCWIRGDGVIGVMVNSFHSNGDGIICGAGNSYSWREIERRKLEHSTDRKTWFPCTVTEEQP